MVESEATTASVPVDESLLAEPTATSGLLGGGLPPSNPEEVEAARLAAVGALPPAAPLFGGGSPPSEQVLDEASRLAALGASAPVQPHSPVALPVASAREGSRSPRRQEHKASDDAMGDGMVETNAEETNAEKAASPSPKVLRGDKDADALSARARSASSAASAASSKPLPAEHYAALAATIQSQLPLPGAGSAC